MKGMVFLAVNELVESQFGIEAWEDILNQVNPECGGIYTSTEDYPDEDVVKYVLAISDKLGVPPADVTRTFGTFLFGELNKKYEIFTKVAPDLFTFLSSIETVIHKEVRKLYHNPSLPTIECEKSENRELKMRYSSPRKLCYLAEGLIQGAAEHYGDSITLDHEVCMHNGSDFCEIRVTRNE